MGLRLPSDYRLSPDRIPTPGASITEAIGLDELVEYSRTADAVDVAIRPGTAAFKFAKAVVPKLLKLEEEKNDVSTD